MVPDIICARYRAAEEGGTWRGLIFSLSSSIYIFILLLKIINKEEGVGERLTQTKCRGDGCEYLNTENELK